jgi:predicted nucleic acid-binding protein
MRRAIVLPADRGLFLRAVDMYDDRLDKAYSLVDCMSMLVMKAHGIEHVLTNDHHFAQERLIIVNA